MYSVLFVCHANVARSQMAKVLMESLALGRQVDWLRCRSAGTHVDVPGESMAALRRRRSSHNPWVIDVMAAIGLDVSDEARTQLRREALEEFDLVVLMASPGQAPFWLIDSAQVVQWDFDDPVSFSRAATAKLEEDIEEAVWSLFETLVACR